MKILIVQSTPNALYAAKSAITQAFPNLKEIVFYTSSFEAAVKYITEHEEFIVITSSMFHDDVDILLPGYEKDGNKLAQLVKEINPRAKVYLYSAFACDKNDFIDFYYHKSKDGENLTREIVEIFIHLRLEGLNKKFN